MPLAIRVMQKDILSLTVCTHNSPVKDIYKDRGPARNHSAPKCLARVANHASRDLPTNFNAGPLALTKAL